MDSCDRVGIREIADREASNLSRLARLIRLFTIGLSLALGPAVFAQTNHLPALRDWNSAPRRSRQVFRSRKLRQGRATTQPGNQGYSTLPSCHASDHGQELFRPGTAFFIIKDDTPRPSRWHNGHFRCAKPTKNSPPTAVFQCLYTLGLIRSAQEHHADAEPLLERALAIQEKAVGRDHVNTTLILEPLAIVYREQGKLDKAESLYLRTIAIHERMTPGENLALAETAEKYAVLLRLHEARRRRRQMGRPRSEYSRNCKNQGGQSPSR